MFDPYPIRVHRFRRLDAGTLLGTADVDIGPVTLMGARLVSTPYGLKAVGPAHRDQGALVHSAHFNDVDLQERVTNLMLREYELRPHPGEREAPCRYCPTILRWERGKPLDARTLTPHECRAKSA